MTKEQINSARTSFEKIARIPEKAAIYKLLAETMIEGSRQTAGAITVI